MKDPVPWLQRFRQAVPTSDATSCPPSDDIWAGAAGELPFERLETLVDHSTTCAQCSEAWRIAQEVRSELMPSVPARPATRAFRSRLAGGAVVGAALAAGLAALLLRQPAPERTGIEAGTRGTDATGDRLRALSADRQPRSNLVLRWSECPGATSYNVTILTLDLSVVHQAVGVAARELKLPGDSVRSAGNPRELLWNVDAVLADGRTVPSPTFKLRVE
jgi:hypothetical protein